MRVIKRKTLVEYYTKEPKAKNALEDWYAKTSRAICKIKDIWNI
jgi:mRNA-degrading endonuclease HigB of HigAB toxin-antitoxin module